MGIYASEDDIVVNVPPKKVRHMVMVDKDRYNKLKSELDALRHQLKVKDKALELACEDVHMECGCLSHTKSYHNKCSWDKELCKQCWRDHFLESAKHLINQAKTECNEGNQAEQEIKTKGEK